MRGDDSLTKDVTTWLQRFPHRLLGPTDSGGGNMDRNSRLFDYSHPAYAVTRLKTEDGRIGVIFQGDDDIFCWSLTRNVNHTATWKRSKTQKEAERCVVVAMGTTKEQIEDLEETDNAAILNAFAVRVSGSGITEDDLDADPWGGDILSVE